MTKWHKRKVHLPDHKQFPLFLASAAFWQDNFPKSSQYIFLFVSNLHCIAILLFTQFDFINSDLTGTYLSRVYDIVRLLTFKDIYTLENKRWLLNLFYYIIWIYFIIMLRTFYTIIKAFKHDRSLARTSNHFFTFLGQLHLSFGFWFINVVIMDKLTLFQADSYRIGGLTGNGHFMSALSITLLVLNYVIGIYFAILSMDPFINSSELGTHTTLFQILTFVFKAVNAILLTVGIFQDFQTTKWITSIFSAAILLGRHFVLVDNFPYYEVLPMKVAGVLSLITVPISIVTFISICTINWDWIIMKNILVVEVILCGLLSKYWINTFERKALENLAIDDSLLKNEKAVIKKLFGLRYLLKSSRMTINEGKNLEYNEIYHWGMMSVYKNYPSFLESFQKQYMEPQLTNEIDAASLNAMRFYYTQFGNRIILDMMKTAIAKLDHNHKTTKLKIIMDSFRLGQSNALLASLASFASFKNLSPAEKIVAERLKNKIQQSINLLFLAEEGKILNIKSYIDLETASAEFLKKIHHNTNSYLDLWTNYLQADLGIKDLFEKSKKIEEQHKVIENHWNHKICKERSFANSFRMIYSIYLSLVKSKPSLAYKILDKDRSQKDVDFTYDSKNEPVLQTNLNSLGTMAFHVSMLRETLGRIVHTTSNTRDLLGWTRLDTVGRSINMVLPSMMQERHNTMLLNYLNRTMDNTNEGNISLYQNISSFVKDKAGYVLPCYVYLSIHPYIQDDLIFMALLRVDKTKRNQILINENGYIEECSRDIAMQLKLRAERKMHISDICEDYHIIESLLKKHAQSKSQNYHQKSQITVRKTTVIEINQLESMDAPEKSDASDDYDYINTTDFLLNFHVPKHFWRGHESESQVYFVKVTKNTFQNLNFFVLDLHEYKDKGYKHVPIVPRQLEVRQEDLTENDTPEIPLEKLNEDNTEIGTSPVFRYLPRESLTKRRATETERFNSTENIQITARVEETKDDFLSPTTRGDRERLLITTSRKREEPVEVVKDKKAMLWDILGTKKVEGEMSVASSRGQNFEIEKAVGTIPKNGRLKALKVMGFMFILITAGLLLGFQIRSDNTTKKVKGNISILSYASLRLTYLCNINKFERMYILSNLGLLTTNRFAVIGFTLPTLYAIVASLPTYLNEVKNVSTGIRNSLYQIESSLQDDLLAQLPIYDVMDNGTIGITTSMSLFDLVTQIYVKGNFLIKRNPYSVPRSDPQLTFVLNNTLNYPLIASEQTVSILIEDTKLKLHAQRRDLIVCIVCMALSGIVVWALFYNTAKAFVWKRNHFIDILLRLDEEYIKKNNSMVAKFAGLLESNHMDYKSLNQKIDQDNLIAAPPSKQTHRIIRKNANLHGINVPLTVLSLLLIIFVLLGLVMYLVIFGIMSSHADSTIHKIDLMATSNLNLYKTALLFTTIYEYVHLNKTTKLKNVPIQQEWERLFNELTQAQDFLINNMLNVDTGLGNNPVLVQMITGDICDLISTGSGVYVKLCKQLATDVLKSGLIGLNSFELSTLQRVKSYFDNSNRTNADMFAALNMNDFILLEVIDYYFAYKSYGKINSEIQKTLFSDIDSTSKSFRTTIIIYVVIWTLLGLVVWYKITSALETETNQYRKMLKQVPYGILVTNKQIMNFLIQGGQHSLGPKRRHR